MTRRSRTIFIAIALAILVVAVYAPARHFDFVQLDDPEHVPENAMVLDGLSWPGVVSAFTTAHAGYWIPLVWISHMIDVQLFGLNAGAHHVTNVLLHLANTLLLFFVLTRMTGATWKSAFVSALFAAHPLHVESVAWIAERKDVLSTLFWMLTLLAYAAYADRGGIRRYLTTLAAFALGLMAKPMLVTMPFVLLLLDVWPLDRARGLRQLVVEKIPFLVLAIGASIVAFITQQGSGAVNTLEAYSIAQRLQNAAMSYALYLGKAVWPVNLQVAYPFLDNVPAESLALALLTLIGLSALAIWMARRELAVLAGWLWYLGTLVPVIGLVQVGIQGMADRFTYVPLIGVFIAMAWGLQAVVSSSIWQRRVLPAIAVALVVVLAVVARRQVQYWQDNVTLFTHTAMVGLGVDEYTAHIDLGTTLGREGRIDEAARHFAEAIRLKPDSVDAHANLGVAFAKMGRTSDARHEYEEALRVEPSNTAVRQLLDALNKKD